MKIKTESQRKITSMLTYLGQFIAHDLILTRKSNTTSNFIYIPKCDNKYDLKCTGTETIEYGVSETIELNDGDSRQLNDVTSYLDGSVIYGSSEEIAMQLRTGIKVICIRSIYK